MRTIEQACAEYIDRLHNTSPHAPYNTTHFILRDLYVVYGKDKVNDEIDRQFAKANEEVE